MAELDPTLAPSPDAAESKAVVPSLQVRRLRSLDEEVQEVVAHIKTTLSEPDPITRYQMAYGAGFTGGVRSILDAIQGFIDGGVSVSLDELAEVISRVSLPSFITPKEAASDAN